MRKRGANLNSPEANFIFGGADNESVYRDLDGRVAPYDRPTAAVDHAADPKNGVSPSDILTERDKAIGQIDLAIPDAAGIEAERIEVAKKLDELSTPPTVDQQR